MENSAERIPRPATGLLLHTIRITNHVAGHSFEINVRQADRLNQITAETFGKTSQPHGMDWLSRNLRKRIVVRWLR